MNFVKSSLSLIALASVLAGCNQTTQAPAPITVSGASAIQSKIRQLDADWMKTVPAHSADGWISFYSDDAVVLPPNEKTAADKASIHTAITGLFSLKDLSITWTDDKIIVSDSGDMAYLYGTYKMHAKDPSGAVIDDVGKNIEIWRKQANGEWKCSLDAWSSDLPAASAK